MDNLDDKIIYEVAAILAAALAIAVFLIHWLGGDGPV
jgi:hypothetical protein